MKCKNATGNFSKFSEKCLWRGFFLIKSQLAVLQATVTPTEKFFRDKIEIILLDIIQKRIKEYFLMVAP